MQKPLHFIAAITGLMMAGLAFIGGLSLLKTTAWEVAEIRNKVFTGALLTFSAAAGVAAFTHLARGSRASGVIAGIMLLLLCAYPLVASFYYLFIGPSYGGMIGGLGAAIVLAEFLISLLATSSGVILLCSSAKIRNEKTE